MIKVEPYTNEWAVSFEQLKEVYLAYLGGIAEVEHVGSTAVPGLDAKPVMDIDIIVQEEQYLDNVIQQLSNLGYRHLGNRGIPGREAFKRQDNTVPHTGNGTTWPEHHLYLCLKGNAALNNHLLLRNRLRADKTKRDEYAALKHRLVAEDPHNMDKYVEGKTAFITSILNEKGVAPGDLAAITQQNKAMDNIITPCSHSDYPELTNLWEASVRATHHFLSEEDIIFFRPLILNEYLKSVDLYCIKHHAHIAGFIGLSAGAIEMLFIHPGMRGRGIGRQLTDFAITQKQATSVDVNEQNTQAVGFYEKMGFVVKNRSEIDGFGKPYPLLHMEL